jgi:hypothetical protein
MKRQPLVKVAKPKLRGHRHPSWYPTETKSVDKPTIQWPLEASAEEKLIRRPPIQTRMESRRFHRETSFSRSVGANRKLLRQVGLVFLAGHVKGNQYRQICMRNIETGLVNLAVGGRSFCEENAIPNTASTISAAGGMVAITVGS